MTHVSQIITGVHVNHELNRGSIPHTCLFLPVKLCLVELVNTKGASPGKNHSAVLFLKLSPPLYCLSGQAAYPLQGDTSEP